MSRVIRSHRRPPAGAALALAVAVLVAAAGCKDGDDAGQTTTAPPTTMVSSPGSTAPATPGTSPASVPPTTPAPTTPVSTRCRAGDLRLEVSESGASAGHRHALLLFTNTGAAPCTVEGYPGVSFLDATGGQVGYPAQRLENPTAPIVLAPGEQAHAGLNVSNAYNFGEECGEPVHATAIRVFPPDETAALQAALGTDVCPNLAMVDIGPMFAGAEAASNEDLGA
jgi:hypothetical protein